MRSHLLYLALFCSTCTYCKGNGAAKPCPEPVACVPAVPVKDAQNPPTPEVPPPPTIVVKEPVCAWTAPPPETGAHTHRLGRALPGFPWQLQATFGLRARVTTTPVKVGADRWVVGDHKGRIQALDVARRQERWTIRPAWQAKTGDAVWSAPVLSPDGKTLWVGSDDDQLHQFDAVTGAGLAQVTPFACTPKKKTDPEAARCDQDAAFLVFPDGGLLTGGAGISRVDASGKVLWQHPVTTHVRGSAALDVDGHLYVATLGGEVLSLTADGKLRWQAHARGQCDSTPLLAGGCTVIVGCDDRTLTAFSTIDGRVKWRLYAPEGFRGGGALSPDGATLYWGNLDRYLYAVSVENGKVQWRYRTAGRQLIPPLVDTAGRVLVFPEEKRLYLLDAAGTLAGTFVLPAIAEAHPAWIDERTLLLPLETGEVLLFSGK
ncbi:PQQ-binding-like beta-propeller repeat protein [Myxococcota bacterium]|nr:PQQ-binding-like beta-propeller repeat protein [Myxococcota bacterium]MBU1410371.1 PQQ-binding-like beta-propeller repeat protein [Myxococcota bacterium]MBU1511952.1 PQQ-binding-like beta-propeller repeat protein [Myxococcota bacterium]